jgi:Tfp pilus assembly protein PilF
LQLWRRESASLFRKLIDVTIKELFDQAVRYHRCGNVQQAEALYRQVVQAAPAHAAAHRMLGLIAHQAGQQQTAIALLRQAVRLDGDNADAHFDLGQVLFSQGDLAEGIECCRQTLRINPHHADAHHNLSVTYTLMGMLPEAREHNEQALRISPQHNTALFQRAMMRLLHGDFAGAWQEYDQRRMRLLPDRIPRAFEQPRWDGSTLRGKTILLHADQGLGSTIQFVRFLPLVKQRVDKVLLECQAALGGLLANAAGADEVISQGMPLPRFDVQAPLVSLPAIFGTTLETIPAAVPYLSADPAAAQRWKAELAGAGPFKVGIAWQGNPKSRIDRYRSVPLAQFKPLAHEGVRLVSLQVGPGTDQLPAAPFPIIDLGSRFDPNSMADLAAALVNLDLVVTVETAVAHLAGALGVPVWVALSVGPDWRWLLDRSDSPWYPTMRLFRQCRFGDWAEVFERVAAEIRNKCGAPGGVSPASHHAWCRHDEDE